MAAGTYKRLLAFLRPHRSLLAGNILANVTAATLDVFAFTLLIPFLNTLFGKTDALPDLGWLTAVMEWLIGSLMVPGQPMASLGGVITIIVVMVIAKNIFVWIGGQFGASLQERITRDLRDAVFRHMQRLPLGWFTRHKTGQVMSRILGDAEQAKAIIAEVATRTIQSAAQVIVTVVALFRMSVDLALVALVVVPLITTPSASVTPSSSTA
jgi:subfamily B ATP-binding cassette protein MsbA